MSIPKLSGDLYDCYLTYMKESQESMLKLLSDKKSKQRLLKHRRPLSREEFFKDVERMDSNQRQELEERVRNPYQEHKRKMLAFVKKTLKDLWKSPKLADEAQKTLEKLLANVGFRKRPTLR